jgi:hypothetical protein
MNFSFYVVLFFVSILNAQIFIPFGFYQRLVNCTPTYCPTLTPVSATLRGSTGMTQIVSANADDANLGVTLPFSFSLGGTGTTSWFLGSNTYITMGSGSSAYSALSASNPAIPKFHLGSADNSWQRVWTVSGTNYFRTRYEGTAATSGTPGSPNIVYEFTFFRPTTNYQFVQVVFGVHNQSSGQFGVANAATYYSSMTPITANSSYVMWSVAGGTSWNIIPNYSITGAGTNL